MAIKKVFIVGCGLMGSGIAQVCAQAGIQVFMNDVNQEILNQALKGIRWSVGKLIEKGKLKEDLETIMARISPLTDFNRTSQVDLAIEAVFEKLELKQEIFKKLDQFGRPETLFASNTSAIPITEIATVTQRPERVLGLHFFNPVPMMEVVEVIKGMKTLEETIQLGIEFVRSIGKEPIRVERDVPGFLLNRINLIGYVEAIRLLEEGIGTVEDIDKGVRLAFGRRMGPFETGDLVGLDVSLGALTAIYEESKDIRYYPPQLLKRKVKAGELGRKTGRGWYEYNPNGSKKEK
ncbi:MAG: 3-hydroxybutyryl-CoA dehydrogenase [Deltaproteobacteria bacterium CG_4_8_14_3_um_filter_45_9]|nr:MAG: 3-hydroxybutyryl-CoA dehydrogenase [Deltaproteobacteria bacterium CG_4_8_14_3_um_filter_45_9]